MARYKTINMSLRFLRVVLEDQLVFDRFSYGPGKAHLKADRARA